MAVGRGAWNGVVVMVVVEAVMRVGITTVVASSVALGQLGAAQGRQQAAVGRV